MVGEVFAGLGAFKTMLDLAKRFKDIDDRATRNTVAIELQEKILAAQEQQSALVAQVRALEEEVAALKAWDADKQRYQLTKIGKDGVFAYGLKEGMEAGEPDHKLCVNCYNQGQKSVLQMEVRVPGMDEVLACPRCGADIYVSGHWRPEHSTGRGRR